MRTKIYCIFVLLLIAGIVCYSFFIKDFNQITKGMTKQAVCIVDEGNKIIHLDTFMKDYGKRKYYAHKGSHGNTAKRTWYFLREDGELLFSFTDLGNRSLVMVTFGEEEIVYRSF